MTNDPRLPTIIARGTGIGDPTTGAISTPIYQSATFRHASLESPGMWDYTRQANPTRTELEKNLALMERASHALAFSSGMAAVAAVLDLLKTGDRVMLSEDLYGGTYRLFDLLATQRGITFELVDTSDPAAVVGSWDDAVRMLFIETPSNPMMRVTDIAAMADIAHRNKALLVVDNTFLSPFLQRPLSLGADIVVHSGTKFLAGHNDTLAGFTAVNDDELGERLALIQKTTGAVLSPFDSWLTLRGMKTLALRMRAQQESAHLVAERLATHPGVSRVHYVGLSDHPGHALNAKQADGAGAMISFNLRDVAMVPVVLRSVRLVLFAESLGGTESLITYPWTQTHAAIPEDLRRRIGVDETLLRLSIGIEDTADILDDLLQALERR